MNHRQRKKLGHDQGTRKSQRVRELVAMAMAVEREEKKVLILGMEHGIARLEHAIAEKDALIARQAQHIAALRAALEQHPLVRWDRQDEEDAQAR